MSRLQEALQAESVAWEWEVGDVGGPGSFHAGGHPPLDGPRSLLSGADQSSQCRCSQAAQAPVMMHSYSSSIPSSSPFQHFSCLTCLLTAC